MYIVGCGVFFACIEGNIVESGLVRVGVSWFFFIGVWCMVRNICFMGVGGTGYFWGRRVWEVWFWYFFF